MPDICALSSGAIPLGKPTARCGSKNDQIQKDNLFSKFLFQGRGAEGQEMPLRSQLRTEDDRLLLEHTY